MLIVKLNTDIQLGELIGTIATILCSLFVLFRQRHYDMKSQQHADKQHDEDMDEQTRQYEEKIKSQTEVNRIAVEPYLTFEEKDVKFTADSASYQLHIEVTLHNAGNNSALHPQVEMEYDPILGRALAGNIVFQNLAFETYHQEKPISSQIIRVDNTGTAFFNVQYKYDDRDIEKNRHSIAEIGDEFIFKITFEDFMSNKYKQCFSIQYKMNHEDKLNEDKAEIKMLQIGTPILVEESDIM